MISEEEKKILEEAEAILRREEAAAAEGQDYRSPYSQDPGPDYAPEFGYFDPGAPGQAPEYSPSAEETAPAQDDVPDLKQKQRKDSGKKGKDGKKKHHPGRVIFLILLILLLIFGGLFAAVYFYVGKTNYQPFDPIQEEASYNLPGKNEKGVRNILLIGTDGRDPNVESRSDSMIVVSICPLQHRIYLTSILRDSYVEIPGYGQNRINHAFQMGGPRLLIQTIEQNFGIRIDQYVKVDFYSFVDIIDAIGGVDIDVTDEEVHYVNAYLSEINQLMGIDAEDSFLTEGGRKTLNGRQALAFSRIRYIGTDFQRTARQRMVLEAAVDRLKHSSPKTILHAGTTVLQNITTDLSDLQMTLLVFRGIFLVNYDFVSDRIPYDGLWWNDLTPEGQEVLGIDFPSTRTQFRTTVYGSR